MNDFDDLFSGYEEFRPYFIINASKKDSNQSFFQQCSSFTNYYNFIFLLNPPKKIESKINHYILSGDGLMRFHELKFLEDKLYRIEMKKYHENEKLYSKFIDLLGKLVAAANSNLITIEIQKFLSDSAQIPHKIRITSYINMIYNNLTIYPVDSHNKSQVQNEIERLLRNFGKESLTPAVFAPIHPSEPYLMALLMSPCFQYKEMITNLINVYPTTPSNVFSVEMVESVGQIVKDTGLKKPKDIFLFICLYRYIYEELYIKFTDLLRVRINEEQAKILSNLTLNDLQLIPEFSPKFEPNQHPKEVFPFAEDFKDAVAQLSKIYFVCCPFDSLNYVHEAVKSIEKGASRSCNFTEIVFSFDTIFSLFMACTIAAEVYDIESIATICQDFMPVNRLSPDFEYAKAKIIAVAAEMKNLVDSMKK